MTKNKYLSLTFILLITFLASGIGGFTTATFKEPWYSQIILPSFNPPSWVFGPVWTTLYILMSVAIWRIWINYYDNKILNLYFLHLFFNMIWSIIFFGFIKTPLTDNNEFPMPFLKTPEYAAEKIYNGLVKGKAFEIHFPKGLTLTLKFLRILPYKLYLFLVDKFVKR